jgi:hypothetical protein
MSTSGCALVFGVATMPGRGGGWCWGRCGHWPYRPGRARHRRGSRPTRWGERCSGRSGGWFSRSSLETTVSVTFSVSVAGISGVEINEPYRAGGMSDGRMAVESVELRIPRSGERDLQGWCSRCGGTPRTWVRGVPRCGGSALLERRDNIGRGGRIQQRRVMPIPPAAGVGVGGRIRRGLRNGHNVRGPHVAGIGHAGQPDGCTGDDAGGDGRQGDVAGDATGDGGVNFVLL